MYVQSIKGDLNQIKILPRLWGVVARDGSVSRGITKLLACSREKVQPPPPSFRSLCWSSGGWVFTCGVAATSHVVKEAGGGGPSGDGWCRVPGHSEVRAPGEGPSHATARDRWPGPGSRIASLDEDSPPPLNISNQLKTFAHRKLVSHSLNPAMTTYRRSTQINEKNIHSQKDLYPSS